MAWRDFWAFGSTGLGDFGCHDLNTAVRAFELPLPSRIEETGAGPMDSEIAPHGSLVHYHFSAGEKRPPIRMTWYDGGLMPPAHEAMGAVPYPKRGSLFIGEKGVIQCDGSGGAPRLYPEARKAEYKVPAPRLKRANGHHRDWLDACKGGEPATSPFAYAAHLTEIVLLGVLSLRTQKPIAWDAPNMKATGLPAADPFIRESTREGWEIV